MNRIKRIFSKVKKSFKRDGFWRTLKKIARAVKYNIIIRIFKRNKNILGEYVDVNSFKNVIVFENNFCWDKIMKQRPQQIAENLPADTLMLYHTHEDGDFKTEKKKRIRKIKDNLVLIDLGYYRDAVMLALAEHKEKYVMVYSTDFIEYERLEMYKDNGYEIIYEYVDDINVDLMGEEMSELLQERHEKILTSEDGVYPICTANSLKEKAQKLCGADAMLVTNGVDYDTFKYAPHPVPEDLLPIKEKYKYIICYYGALAAWFDYDIVKKVAENKDYGIVLIGFDYDKTLDKSGILDIDNVYYLGRKPYDELPSYGCNVDVLTIPFVINDITLATSPVKIFEYMAMERPIVTTDLPECRKYKSVLISKTADEFAENIDRAVKLIGNSEYMETERAEAMANTWKSKAKDIMDFVENERKTVFSKRVANALNTCEYDRIIVWRSPFGWNVPLYQRPQHIANQFSRMNCLVFYEVTYKTDGVVNIRKQQDNLYLVNVENGDNLTTLMNAIMTTDKPWYVQIYSTNWSMGYDEMHNYVTSVSGNVLYEYIDDISPELSGTEEIIPSILEKYNYAMEHKKVPVVTTAAQLYNDVVAKRGTENMAFACNGVDYNFFADVNPDFVFEKKFIEVINNGKKNLCYYGALASWFDYELIKKINKTNRYNIILFGVKYDDTYDNEDISSLKNVYFFGSRDYRVLKNYAAKMDILTIPFVINSITKATSPLKLFEYMALKKPIVTTAMDECKKYKSVNVAETHEQFIEMLDGCEKLAKDKEYMALLEKEALENDWSKKAEAILDMLKANEKNKI